MPQVNANLEYKAKYTRHKWMQTLNITLNTQVTSQHKPWILGWIHRSQVNANLGHKAEYTGHKW